MTPRKQQQAQDERERAAQTEWRARADLYPPAPESTATGVFPQPAYRQHAIVPFPDVERFSWQNQVYDAAAGPPGDLAPDSAEAALTTHPLLSEAGEQAVIAEAAAAASGPQGGAQDAGLPGADEAPPPDQGGSPPADDTKEE